METQFVQCFTMNESKKGALFLKPRFDKKYGIKSLTVITNDNEELELDEDSVLFASEQEGVNGTFWNISLMIKGDVETEEEKPRRTLGKLNTKKIIAKKKVSTKH